LGKIAENTLECAVLVPVILCGGAGSRLWPVSRERSPKPFMVVGGEQTLLEQTIRRGLECAGVAANYLVVTNQEYQFKTAAEMGRAQDAGAVTGIQVLEPQGRNTAPAIALAAKIAIEQFGKDAILLVLPADHLIADVEAFREDVKLAYDQAKQGHLVTFGIPPTSPETGYGYLEVTSAKRGAAAEVLRFVEKPNGAKAQEFLTSGRFLWNSGMFCFSAHRLLNEIERLSPEIMSALGPVFESSKSQNGTLAFDPKAFAQFPSISIDYAVMEKAKQVKVIPANFDWSDIGSWKSVSETYAADVAGNTVSGSAILVDCANTHVQSDNRMIAVVGLENVVVVDTADAVLVVDKNRAQDVKEVVARLKASGHESALLHSTVHRPWGTYTTLQEGPRFKIKRIVVVPGGSLSLQMHHHRSEHWVVVSGTAKVTNGSQTLILSPNQSTYIPVGVVHRLENPGILEVVLIEVQCGDYLGEDDIVRLTDIYGRVENV
jgi:mannose-1-phosphate guanylyltransferase / mannose-6-phosphate isomerase